MPLRWIQRGPALDRGLFHRATAQRQPIIDRVTRLKVRNQQPLDIALDGEIAGRLPADFVVAGDTLRVLTPRDFEDIDD